MPLKIKLINSNSGGVIIFVALMFSVLMGVLGLTVDAGRLYAVQSKAQNAADAALLGAVSTISTTPLGAETIRLFNANYPAGYMGSTVANITVSGPPAAGGEYNVAINITVPLSIMQIFGSSTSSINITSRVNAGYQLSAGLSLELALVFDNSGASGTNSMAIAGNALTTAIFGAAASLNNVHISVLPYDVALDVGDTRVGWIHPGFVARYNNYVGFAGGGEGFIANRNFDDPPNAFADVTDVAPTVNATLFRVPYAYGPGPPRNPGLNPDFVSTNKLALMQFDLNTTAGIQSALNAMQATGGNRRINVGLMWSWFTLSPNWQGLFSAGLPGLPAADSALNSKQLVLVVTGNNNVYTGQVVGGQTYSNDDTTTLQLCQAIQARGIQIYTVGFGAPGSYNQALLQECAAGTTLSMNNFFAAQTTAQLTAAFQTIANNINYSTVRLSQ